MDELPAMTDVPGRAMRTAEIEEPTNRYFIHPLSLVFVRFFARWGVHPNVVSVLGMLLGAAAAAAYYRFDSAPMALLGFALMIGWHVMDGADGQLARLTGKTSDVGRVLDGLCDHLTFALVYLSLAVAISSPVTWILAAAAGISHLVQAGAYEFQRQTYDFIVHGKAAARPVRPEELRNGVSDRRAVARLFARLHLLYVEMQQRVVPENVSASSVAGFGEIYRTYHLAGVKRWSLLCSNYRTVAIFLACLAGDPRYFFLFEIIVLNAALIALTRMQRRNTAAMRAALSKAA